MRNNVLFKFVAILLCAVSLLGCIASAGGMFLLSYTNLYDQTIDQFREQRIQENAEEFARQTALRYASETLGGCPVPLLDNRYLTQDAYLNLFQSGKYHFRLEDAEGNVLSSQGDAIPNGTAYVFPVTGQYLHLVSKETEQERKAQEAQDRANFYGADVVTADGVTIPAEGASVTYASFLGPSGALLLEVYYDGDAITYLFHSPSSFTFENFAVNSAGDLMVNHEGKLVFRSSSNHSNLDTFLSGSPVTEATFFSPGQVSMTLNNGGADVGYLSIDENGLISFLSWDPVTVNQTDRPLIVPERLTVESTEIINNLPQEGTNPSLAAFYGADGSLLAKTSDFPVTGSLYYNAEGGITYLLDKQTFQPDFLSPLSDTVIAGVCFLDDWGDVLLQLTQPGGIGTLELTESRLVFKSTPGIHVQPQAAAETLPPETVPEETAPEPEPGVTVILPHGSKITIPGGEPTQLVEDYARQMAEEDAEAREHSDEALPESLVTVIFTDGTELTIPEGEPAASVVRYAKFIQEEAARRAAAAAEGQEAAEEPQTLEEPQAEEETQPAEIQEEGEDAQPQEETAAAEETVPAVMETTAALVEETVPPTEAAAAPAEETVPATLEATVSTEETIAPTEPVTPVIINGKPLSEYQLEFDNYYDSKLRQTIYVTYVRVPMPEYTVLLELAPDALKDESMYALLGMLRDHRGSLLGILGVCLLTFALTVLYLCLAAGRMPKSDAVRAGGLNRLPLDLYFSLAFGGITLTLVLGAESLNRMYSNIAMYGMMLIGASFAACLLFVAFCFAFVAQIKTPGGFWWRNTLCGHCVRIWVRLVHWLEKVTKETLFPFLRRLLKGTWKFCKAAAIESWHLYKMLLDFCVKFLKGFFGKINRTLQRFFSLLPLTWQWLLTGCVIIFIAALTLNSYNGFAVIIGLMLILGIVLYGAHCFGVLSESTRNMSKGDLNTKVEDKLLLGCFKDFAVDLNDLADVAVVAAQNQLRSERMKTELITNVSHDIKTPLTSIINYVDLLQKPHTEEEQTQYLEVLDRQSQRLKKLIDDLMEMSKANTGNMTVDITTVDAVESVNQALGEFADKLTAAQLTPVFRHTEVQVPMMADGKLVWRVLSNLLSNAVKYAMPGTRIYIDLMELEGKVILSLKNISREELNVDADELMERFVRGDDSRNTEGSGLGLNIARSLMELQKGQLQLLVDGDLFKVTLIFPGA